MSTEENKKVVLRWREEIWIKRNVDIIDELHASDYVGHYSGIPAPIRGREALKQLFAAYLAAFEIVVTPEFLIAEGDMVAVHDTNRVKHRVRFRGSHRRARKRPSPAPTSTGSWTARLWNSGSKLTSPA